MAFLFRDSFGVPSLQQGRPNERSGIWWGPTETFLRIHERLEDGSIVNRAADVVAVAALPVRENKQIRTNLLSLCVKSVATVNSPSVTSD